MAVGSSYDHLEQKEGELSVGRKFTCLVDD